MDMEIATITPSNSGPNIVKGRIQVLTPSGRVLETKDVTAFCRCGHSNDKPFCDGSHKRVGFDSVEDGPDFHKGP